MVLHVALAGSPAYKATLSCNNESEVVLRTNELQSVVSERAPGKRDL